MRVDCSRFTNATQTLRDKATRCHFPLRRHIVSATGVQAGKIGKSTGHVAIQSAKTLRLLSMKNVWSWPLFGSDELYEVRVEPFGTCSSE